MPAVRIEFELKIRLLLLQVELDIVVLEIRLSELQEKVPKDIPSVPTNPNIEQGNGKEKLYVDANCVLFSDNTTVGDKTNAERIIELTTNFSMNCVGEQTTYISEVRDCTEPGLVICALKVKEFASALAPVM